MRRFCGPGISAAVLMGQETSGIFLNYFLLMRYRAPSHWSVNASFGCFGLAFFVYRIVIGTYGTVHYALHYQTFLIGRPRIFPGNVADMSYGKGPWEGPAELVLFTLVAASVLQWYWGAVILRNVYRRLLGKKKPE